MFISNQVSSLFCFNSSHSFSAALRFNSFQNYSLTSEHHPVHSPPLYFRAFWTNVDSHGNFLYLVVFSFSKNAYHLNYATFYFTHPLHIIKIVQFNFWHRNISLNLFECFMPVLGARVFRYLFSNFIEHRYQFLLPRN